MKTALVFTLVALLVIGFAPMAQAASTSDQPGVVQLDDNKDGKTLKKDEVKEGKDKEKRSPKKPKDKDGDPDNDNGFGNNDHDRGNGR